MTAIKFLYSFLAWGQGQFTDHEGELNNLTLMNVMFGLCEEVDQIATIYTYMCMYLHVH